MSKFTTMDFREMGDGCISQIVGAKKLFKDKESFLRYCLSDDCEELECEFEEGKPEWTINNIKEGYIRYYPHMPEGFDIESGYTFCDKGKGAIEIYYLDLQ